MSLEVSHQIIADLKCGDVLPVDREIKRGPTGHLIQEIIADILSRLFLDRLGHGFNPLIVGAPTAPNGGNMPAPFVANREVDHILRCPVSSTARARNRGI